MSFLISYCLPVILSGDVLSLFMCAGWCPRDGIPETLGVFKGPER